MNYAVILAAGKGMRMNSNHLKPALKIFDKEIIKYVYDAIPNIFENVICVVGNKKEEIVNTLKDNVKYVVQDKPLGTAHSLLQSLDYINVEGNTLVLVSDIPLIDKETLVNLYNFHLLKDNDITLLNSFLDDPKGYGRIKKKHGKVLEIIEEKFIKGECINEVYSGVMIVKNHILGLLKEIKKNEFEEYYLTDLVKLCHKKYKVGTFLCEDPQKILGINDKNSISKVSEIIKNRIIDFHIKNGVIIPFKDNVVIYPEVIIKKDTYIDEFVSIKSNNIIENDVKIGPFSNIREGNTIKSNSKIGSFVEVKGSVIGENTKIAHHAYIGDTIVGDNTIIGAGVIIANFNGKRKNKSEIGSNTLVGCNTTIVSPVNIGNNCYIGAGSIIRTNIEDNTFVKPQITLNTLKNKNNSI